MTSRWLAAVVAVALLVSACSEDSVPPTGQTGGTGTAPEIDTSGALDLSFDWTMPPRFGLDANNDGRIDVPNTFEYVHNLERDTCPCDEQTPRFDVVLTASGGGENHEWVIEGVAVPEPVTASGNEVEVSLPEGEYIVTVTAKEGDKVGTASGIVRVDDFLIVTLGDSFAGGEGNPESTVRGDTVTALWLDDGSDDPDDSAIHARHQEAHRSTLSPSGQVALALEEADPRSSVTFVILAATGATIDEGILGPKQGNLDLPAQIDELEPMLGCTPSGCDRKIDALTISIGGNDTGFTFTIGSLVAIDPLLARGAYDELREAVFIRAERLIGDLPAAYGRLADALDTRLDVEATYVTAYPIPSRTFDPDASGSDQYPLCDKAVSDIVFALEVDSDELLMAEQRLGGPLNEAVERAASDHGWVYIDAHLDDYRGHGYCGTEPYDPAEYTGNPWPDAVQGSSDPQVRFFRTASDSSEIQGGGDSGRFTPEQFGTTGTMHPNELGHQVTARALLEAIGR